MDEDDRLSLSETSESDGCFGQPYVFNVCMFIECPTFHLLSLSIRHSVQGFGLQFWYITGFKGVSITSPILAPGHQVFQSLTWFSFSGFFSTMSLSM